MKKLLLLFILMPSLSHAGTSTTFGAGKIFVGFTSATVTPLNGYSDYQTFTIPPQTQNTTILSSFPVLISGTFQFLKTTGNGGKVTEASGADIVFSTVGPGMTPYLNVETETYVNNTGQINAWVQVPIIFATASVNIFMAYGNSAITSRVSWSTNVWDSNYVAVFHYPDGTTLNSFDSTAYRNDGTPTNFQARAAQIDGGVFVNINQNGNETSPDATILHCLGAVTVQTWLNVGRNAFQTMIDKSSIAKSWGLNSTNNPTFARNGGVGTVNATAPVPINIWTFIAATSDAGTGTQNVTHYMNGTPNGTGTQSGTVADTSDTFIVGVFHGNSNPMDGIFDELRVSNIRRTADWIKTDYLTQSNPNKFIQIQPKSYITFQ